LVFAASLHSTHHKGVHTAKLVGSEWEMIYYHDYSGVT